MGFLFPYSAIEATWQADPRRPQVPKPSDLIAARDEALTAFRHPANKACVLFAGVFGSIIPARGDHTRRSDLDVFLVYPEGMQQKAIQLMRNIRESAKRKHSVSVNGRIIPVVRARRGQQPFGPSFHAMWEELDRQGMLVGDPRKLAAVLKVPDGRTVRQEMQSRVLRYARRSRKHQRAFRKIRDANRMDRELGKQWGRCVRPLHLYLNLARKLLWWQHGKLPDDGKEAVFREFRREREFQDLMPAFQALIEIDKAYDDLLERALRNEVTASEYRTAVYGILKRTFEQNAALLAGAVRHMAPPELRTYLGRDGKTELVTTVAQGRQQRDRVSRPERKRLAQA